MDMRSDVDPPNMDTDTTTTVVPVITYTFDHVRTKTFPVSQILAVLKNNVCASEEFEPFVLDNPTSPVCVANPWEDWAIQV
jgi:hypothetical protein